MKVNTSSPITSLPPPLKGWGGGVILVYLRIVFLCSNKHLGPRGALTSGGSTRRPAGGQGAGGRGAEGRGQRPPP